jgi:SAM-dependent methyltransferase
LNIDFLSFKQICIQKTNEESIYCKTKTGYKVKSKEKQAKVANLSNNKAKNYLINEGDDVPAMVDLGIFSKDGKIINSMYDKFKQINHFIELIDHTFKASKMEEITILDFGCGKSYLTFLIYHYFVNMKKIKAKIIGYDIKEDVVKNCNLIAEKYGYDDLKFELSDVSKDALYKGKIDMVITLHACDTATDYALDFAIKNKVKYIFSVPCCQHEINLSIKKGGDFDILMNDGLIKERFSSLLTDSIRTEILRSCGYSVDVIEFVDFAHSPKNLMIRATKNSTKKTLEKVKDLQNKYKFNQKLLELVSKD